MQGPDDHLLQSADPDLLREITGVEPDKSGLNAILPHASERATQRVGLADLGGGFIVFTWPGELLDQAERLYDGSRAPRLLAAADAGGWKVELRPHLAYWRSRPGERLYLQPAQTLTAEEYVAQWAGADGEKIGGYNVDAARGHLWSWLHERGYATSGDDPLLEPFLARVVKANRDVHLRPGLALSRRWSREQVSGLGSRGRLATEIREALSRLLDALDDPPLPAAVV